ncbi:hypothetical protein [Meridianimarinicoccus sp. MJW13]|uniref:hypothetical protein n=1 Tax=Meridianimarinicoccus sp. MJW13 TaxID=2720031 RepID=UPI00186784A1|nr:hypothetical protein [Fluviibacterium sp. MJW13]
MSEHAMHHHMPTEPALEPQFGTRIINPPHQHAFALIGQDTVFGVHMTQYTHEVHKYQIILKLKLPEATLQSYRRARKAYPTDFIVMCNDLDDLFTIPSMAAQETTQFTASIFRGWPTEIPEDLDDPHWFPWALDGVNPMEDCLQFKVEVERIVLFRPFAHHYQTPQHATYYLFGEGDEAHMTTLQTARLANGPLGPDTFGPDYDHVLSLKEAPDWLDKTLLKAGIVISVPSVQIYDPATNTFSIPCSNPFEGKAKVDVQYRGMGPARPIRPGPSVSCITGVANSETMIPCTGEGQDPLGLSPMPLSYYKA